MNFIIEIDNEIVTVQFLQKKNMKRCYIKIIDAKTVQIKANIFFTLQDAHDLIQRKFQWLTKHIKTLRKKELEDGEFYFLGSICKIEDFNLLPHMIDEFYKIKAKEIIPAIVEKYSNKMNLFPKEIKFRKNKSRWGSCSYDNVINLNTNLMKLPFSCIDYVVIHELAHIKHKNHSKHFWDFVALFCPNYKDEEKRIKFF